MGSTLDPYIYQHEETPEITQNKQIIKNDDFKSGNLILLTQCYTEEIKNFKNTVASRQCLIEFDVGVVKHSNWIHHQSKRDEETHQLASGHLMGHDLAAAKEHQKR